MKAIAHSSSLIVLALQADFQTAIAKANGARDTRKDARVFMPKKEPKREERIRDEIIVDANGPEEQAMGWYYYLEAKLRFPFTATCIAERAISPLRQGDEVEIVGMAAEEECEHEIFVETPWERRTLAIPLSQVKPIPQTDAGTQEAIEDWHYWVKQGYEF